VAETSTVRYKYVSDPNRFTGRVFTFAYRDNGNGNYSFGWSSNRPGNRRAILGNKGRVVGYTDARVPGDVFCKAEGRKHALERLNTNPTQVVVTSDTDPVEAFMRVLVNNEKLPFAVRHAVDDLLDEADVAYARQQAEAVFQRELSNAKTLRTVLRPKIGVATII